MSKLIIQLFKFGIVAAIAFIIDYVIYTVLCLVNINYLIANIISFSIAVIFNYIASTKWVFDAKKQTRLDVIIFIILSVIGLGINELLLYIGVDKLLINEFLMKFVATFIVMVYNFVTRKLFIEKKKKGGKKLMFISSTGGHFSELMQLSYFFDKYEYCIVTEKTETYKDLKNKHKDKISFVIFGTKDHMLTYPFKLLANCFISLYLYLRERPDFIITTGTHTAGPMCCLGKIFGAKVIFIETYANITTRTATGNLIYPIADLFIVQWESLLEVYPDAVYGGSIY